MSRLQMLCLVSLQDHNLKLCVVVIWAKPRQCESLDYKTSAPVDVCQVACEQHSMRVSHDRQGAAPAFAEVVSAEDKRAGPSGSAHLPAALSASAKQHTVMISHRPAWVAGLSIAAMAAVSDGAHLHDAVDALHIADPAVATFHEVNEG